MSIIKILIWCLVFSLLVNSGREFWCLYFVRKSYRFIHLWSSLPFIDMKTFESNKLIAEFMGGKYNSQLSFRIGQDEIWLPIHGVCSVLDRGKTLNYHKSWDWLIPVVHEVREVEQVFLFDDTDVIDNLDSALLELNLGNTYKAVIEFIKFYNENK